MCHCRGGSALNAPDSLQHVPPVGQTQMRPPFETSASMDMPPYRALEAAASRTHWKALVWCGDPPTGLSCSIAHLEAGPMKPSCRRAARRKPQLKAQTMWGLHV